ncbi:SGNH/GDSL hydrolase family protein [Nioella nitratireducens]|uniref:SGNH/GDSL hydrolase family protein n=1 Tax=Nioella nitratireducens TaxID=1287720 RepID=UPI0008FCE469|nr:SGNH/GDSL hydrolase family protein [Nioella nitratireducens]
MPQMLLTFGDSNTHGTPPIETPGLYGRFGPDIRWPQVALSHLGDGWHLAEEGLPGRTTGLDDPVMGAHMNGQTGLRIALESHGRIDVLTIMLGTNDLKTRFSPSVAKITGGVAGLLDIALSEPMQTRHEGFKVLLICPPPVVETGPIRDQFWGAEAVGPHLADAYRALAKSRGVGFLDAGQVIKVSGQDGIHFDPVAHRALGTALAVAIRGL